MASGSAIAQQANTTPPSEGATTPVPSAPSPEGCSKPLAWVKALSTSRRPRIGRHAVHRHDVIRDSSTVAVPEHGWIRLRVGHGTGYLLRRGRLRLTCSGALRLIDGSLTISGAPKTLRTPQSGLVPGPGSARARIVVTTGLTRVWLDAGRARIARTAAPDGAGRIHLRPGDKALVRTGLRPQLDTWPFPPSPLQRRATAADRLPAFWADGSSCATGCRPAGALTGWPIKPFRGPHGLRAGLNERRRANMHIGVDIQARDGANVYAVQSGTANVTDVGGVDERVQVGNYSYWHIRHRVKTGQRVVAHKTIIGTVLKHAGHVHLSEISGGRYLNPLRPRGRVLAPWSDTLEPLINQPSVFRNASGYRVVVEAYDPQSFRELVKYRTPVLGVAALAYRAFDAKGQDVTGLRWALRGSQHYSDGARFVIYAHGAHSRAWGCFAVRLACPPLWKYRLTDGLTPPIPRRAKRLVIYAYDWAGNVSVRETQLGSATRSPTNSSNLP